MKNLQIKKWIVSSALLMSIVCHSQSFKFDFGPGKVEQGYIQVLPESIYSADKGYGFEFSSSVYGKSHKGRDALRNDYISSDKPFYFSINLPEGNYNVKVILGDKKRKICNNDQIRMQKIDD